LAAAVGGGYALASGSGTIHACVQKKTRAIYKAPCRHSDKKISWSKVGPVGPRGLAGANGTNGVGPGYSVSNRDGLTTPDTANHSIATLPIPQAGAYAVTAKVQVFSGTNVNNVCNLHTSDGFDDADSSGATDSLGQTESTIPLQMVHTFSGPGSVILECGDNPAGTTFSLARITAIRLTSVTNTAVTG
jgi:hypothetical protein